MNSNLNPLSYPDEAALQVETIGGADTHFTPLTLARNSEPKRCVIGAETYRAWFAQLSSSLPVTLAVESTQGLESHCRDLREQLRKMPMPKAIDTNLRRELVTLCQRGPVSVRSSATLEDNQGVSKTATRDTYLGVVGVDAVIAQIIDCFVSMWDDKAVKIWADRGVDPANISMVIEVS